MVTGHSPRMNRPKRPCDKATYHGYWVNTVGNQRFPGFDHTCITSMLHTCRIRLLGAPTRAFISYEQTNGTTISCQEWSRAATRFRIHHLTKERYCGSCRTGASNIICGRRCCRRKAPSFQWAITFTFHHDRTLC
jgi:hypothetical protein